MLTALVDFGDLRVLDVCVVLRLLAMAPGGLSGAGGPFYGELRAWFGGFGGGGFDATAASMLADYIAGNAGDTSRSGVSPGVAVVALAASFASPAAWTVDVGGDPPRVLAPIAAVFAGLHSAAYMSHEKRQRAVAVFNVSAPRAKIPGAHSMYHVTRRTAQQLSLLFGAPGPQRDALAAVAAGAAEEVAAFAEASIEALVQRGRALETHPPESAAAMEAPALLRATAELCPARPEFCDAVARVSVACALVACAPPSAPGVDGLFRHAWAVRTLAAVGALAVAMETTPGDSSRAADVAAGIAAAAGSVVRASGLAPHGECDAPRLPRSYVLNDDSRWTWEALAILLHRMRAVHRSALHEVLPAAVGGALLACADDAIDSVADAGQTALLACLRVLLPCVEGEGAHARV